MATRMPAAPTSGSDPGAPKSVAKPGSDQYVTDEEQQEAEAEQDEVLRDVPGNGDGDERLHGEEAEQHDAADARRATRSARSSY